MGFPLSCLSSALWSHSCSSMGVGKIDGFQELLSLFSSPRGAVTVCAKVVFKPCPFPRLFSLGETGWCSDRKFIRLLRTKEVIIHTHLQNLSIIFPCEERLCCLKQPGMKLQGKKRCSVLIIVSSPPSDVSIKEHFLYSAYLQMC